AATDEDRVADEGATDEAGVHRRFEPELQVAGNLRKRLPRMGDVFEERPVNGPLQVEVTGRGKSGVHYPLRESRGPSRVSFTSQPSASISARSRSLSPQSFACRAACRASSRSSTAR